MRSATMSGESAGGTPCHHDKFWHIGLPKTATTYLQRCFFPSLRGIHYFRRLSWRRAAYAIEHASKTEKVLYWREAGHNLIEHARWLAQYHPDIRPIIVLRRHRDHIASYYRNRIKNGFGEPFEEFLDLNGDNGVWAVRDFMFYEKLVALESIFQQRPYVLFYDELQRDPERFFDRLTRYLGVRYEPSRIRRAPVNASPRPEALKWTRRWVRVLLPNTHRARRHRLNRIYAKLGRHVILWIARAVPHSRVEDGPLIDDEALDRIDAFYGRDWERCVAYAQGPTVDRETGEGARELMI